MDLPASERTSASHITFTQHSCSILSQDDIPVLLGRELRGIDNLVLSDKVYSSWDAIVDK